jgi:hypothetical protein
MKEVRVSVTYRTSACLALVGMAFMLASCGLNPFATDSGTGPGPVATGTPSATATPAATSAAAPAKRAKFAKSPTPSPADPLLASGKWGYLDIDDVVTKRTGVIWAYNSDVVAYRRAELTLEESKSLLKTFRNSPKVKRAVKAAGGRSSETTYGVVDIQASDDVPVDTPWVYATLRAAFPTRYGVKVLESHVYRQKTSKGLDRRPLVSNTIVGYVATDGSIPNPVQVKLK